jgi:hypothetical protein
MVAERGTLNDDAHAFLTTPCDRDETDAAKMATRLSKIRSMRQAGFVFPEAELRRPWLPVLHFWVAPYPLGKCFTIEVGIGASRDTFISACMPYCR